MTTVPGRPLAEGRRVWLTAAAWVIAATIIWVFSRAIDWQRAVAVARTVQPAWLVVALVCNASILAFWAALWRTVLPPWESVPYRVMVQINAVASAVMNTIPLFAGHASAAAMLVNRGKTSQESALSVIALDQLGEGLAKVALFSVAAALAPIPPWMRIGIGVATAGCAALLIGLLVAANAHQRIAGSATGQSDGAVSRWVAKVRAFAGEWARGLNVLRSRRRSAVALACALAMKLAEAAAIVSVQHSFGISLGIGGTALVLAALTLGTMLPLAPGNLGTYEAAVFLAYRLLGIPGDQALALAVLQHVCFLIPAIGIGWGVLVARPLR